MHKGHVISLSFRMEPNSLSAVNSEAQHGEMQIVLSVIADRHVFQQQFGLLHISSLQS